MNRLIIEQKAVFELRYKDPEKQFIELYRNNLGLFSAKKNAFLSTLNFRAKLLGLEEYLPSLKQLYVHFVRASPSYTFQIAGDTILFKFYIAGQKFSFKVYSFSEAVQRVQELNFFSDDTMEVMIPIMHTSYKKDMKRYGWNPV